MHIGIGYVTTNIRVPKDVLRSLKLKALQEDKSVAQLIREAIEQILFKGERDLGKREFEKDPFLKIIGMCRTGVKDGAIHHDRDIYGIKR